MSKMLLILFLILAAAAESQAQSPRWQQQAEIEIEPGTPYPSAEKIRLIASRAGGGQVLAANGQFGNRAKSDEHWWRLYEGFWIRNDQVRESGDCNSLPVVGR